MYQAPEILRNSGVGLPSDVFSFGIIMWEIISGEIAYEVQQNLERRQHPRSFPTPSDLLCTNILLHDGSCMIASFGGFGCGCPALSLCRAVLCIEHNVLTELV
jgi:hypothetical protein